MVAHTLILPEQITGCVLAGGRGARMGGVDKGLQTFHGQALALHALQRLAPQVGPLLINANRNAEQYAKLGLPLAAKVCADALPDYPGPLAGFMAGLVHCQTEWLLCVPCDTPLFPLDLAAQMLAARGEADIVIAHGWDNERALPGLPPQLRAQPVFCLLRQQLAPSLEHFITSGGRKIDAWTQQHACAHAVFDRPGDAQAFSNANTLGQLHELEQTLKSPASNPRP